MPRKVSQIKAALLKKGFVECKTHHSMFWLYAENKKTSIKTRLSHGAREYGDWLLSQVKKQIRLTDQQDFDNFMECPMTGAQYLEKLVKAGIVILPSRVAKTPSQPASQRRPRRHK